MALGLLIIEWVCVAGELVNKTALVMFGKYELKNRFRNKQLHQNNLHAK
jgi:hypothetical protein